MIAMQKNLLTKKKNKSSCLWGKEGDDMERYLGAIVVLVICGFSLISWEISRVVKRLNKIIEILSNRTN